MKRLIMLAVALFMSMSMITYAAAANDLTGHYFEADMKKLIDKGIMNGFEDGTYRPDDALTRAQFAALIVTALELGAAPTDPNEPGANRFKDVKEDSWYGGAVASASRAGIINGYPDGTFKPNEKISREHMAIMIVNSLRVKGMIIGQEKTADFADKKDIHTMSMESVQIVYHLGIIKGTSTQPLKFSPKANTTRGMAAAVLNRVFTTLNPPEKLDFEIAVPSKNSMDVVKDYRTFEDARKNVGANQVVLKGNKVIWMSSGAVAANKFTEIYEDSTFKSPRTYVPTGAELKYIGATETAVQVELAGKKGYVKQDNVNLIPSVMVEGRSFYSSSGGLLTHTIYNPIAKTSVSTGVIGKAPDFMKDGQKYFSWDGYTYTDVSGNSAGVSYGYFQFLPLSSKTNYTAEELDQFIENNYPEGHKKRTYNGKVLSYSPLEGTGKFYKAMEEKYSVNALYLMAHAIHESDWGTSTITQEKNNLFGMQAYDSDALKNAKAYASFEESIEDAAKYVTTAYQNPNGAQYNGAVLGNKAIGMNVKYASDPFWGEKAAAHMFRADRYLGGRDYGQYELGYTTEPNLNVRSASGTTNTTILYKVKNTGVPVIIKGEETVDGAIWYNIQSDDQRYVDAYAYGKGSLGEYIKRMPIVK